MPATGIACVKPQELTVFTEEGKISGEKKLPDFCGLLSNSVALPTDVETEVRGREVTDSLV